MSVHDRPITRQSKPLTISENIKKVAITMSGAHTLFLELDQNCSLTGIVKHICETWKLVEPDNYALQFVEPRHAFITEQNRVEIQNGNVLQLADAPDRTAVLTLEHLQCDKLEQRLAALKELVTLSSDITFAAEFINKMGLQAIIALIVEGKYEGDPLANILKVFVQLMDHGLVAWDILQADLVTQVANCVKSPRKIDPSSLQSSLEILESVVLHSGMLFAIVQEVISPHSLLPHLQNSNPEVQKNSIALVNALFSKADIPKKKELANSVQSSQMRSVILNNVIPSGCTGPEMARQLYVLQVHLLNQVESRMNKPADHNDPNSMKDLSELHKIAFDIEIDPMVSVTRKTGNPAKDFKKLGFLNFQAPIDDFKQTPPGVLALDNLAYFARTHQDTYTKIVLENSVRGDEHDCPIAQGAVALTQCLCDILSISKKPSDESQTYYPMIFCHEYPFQELFCVCMHLLNKSWKEMRAKVGDFKKVLDVVHEQITRALQSQPSSFEALRTQLGHLSYSELMKMWEKDIKNREEWESQAKPIIELRHQIEPEILQLIGQQRINQLIEGTMFMKFTIAGKRIRDLLGRLWHSFVEKHINFISPANQKASHKWWYCRLAPNQKAFHYGDCEETEQAPAIEQLPTKLNVVDIKSLIQGKECPHVKKEGRKTMNQSVAFALQTDTQEVICFTASNQNEFNMWTDGINCLLGNKMSSVQMRIDLDTLMKMELKLRLLDIEGISIPTEPPPIPKLPSNYNFVYQY